MFNRFKKSNTIEKSTSPPKGIVTKTNAPNEHRVSMMLTSNLEQLIPFPKGKYVPQEIVDAIHTIYAKGKFQYIMN